MNKLEVADYLCGLGGATEGCHQSDYVEVVEGLNHNEVAIANNKANHPKVEFRIVDIYKAKDLKRCHIAIAGIECTNHSNAKGGMSRDADSRAMANELFRISIITGCNMFVIENVREFLQWGPVIPKRDSNGVILKIKKGKNAGNPIMIPDPKKKGQYFHKWKYKMMNEYGFINYSERILNAADYGVATTRKRLFMIFAKKDWDIVWPEPTHFKTSDNLFSQKEWIPCKTFIDLYDHGKSIFGRTRKDGTPSPLVHGTLNRIAYGIKKYGLNDQQFISKYYGSGDNSASINEPLHTVRTKDCHALISTDHFYVQNYHNSNSAGSIDQPLKTVVTKDEKAFITVEKIQFIDKYFRGKHNVSSVEEPLGTILTNQKSSLTTLDLVVSEFNRKSAIKPVDEPISTITTFNKRKIQVQFMQTAYTRKTPTVRSVEQPLRTITSFQSPQLVTAELIQFASEYFDQDVVQVLMNSEDEVIGVHIGKGLFLRDIKMRWLTARELASCQGFPEDYKLIGTKSEQIKGIGNSICPPLITAIMNSVGKANQHHIN